MHHMGKIKENWKMPECSIGDYKPIAFFYKNGVVELDFLSEEEGDFLSEQDDSIEIKYPFVEDYKPTIDDFKELGFDTLFE